MRKGLFFSRNHGKISSVIDLDELARAYSGQATVKIYDQFFGQAEQQDMLKTIEHHKLEAVVLAGNSPAYFDTDRKGSVLLQAFTRYGVNQNKIAMANLYEQIALPHAASGAYATAKARLLIDAALAKIAACQDAQTIPVAPKRAVLVLGTTPGGIKVSHDLIDRGYDVYLVDRHNDWRAGEDVPERRQPLVNRVKTDGKVKTLLGTQVTDISGWCGEYAVALQTSQGVREITVGGIVLCVADDREWIARLRPKLRLDTDDDGLLIGSEANGFMIKTKDPGIWILPFDPQADQWNPETTAANAAVLCLTALLDKSRIEHPVMISEVSEAVCGGCGTCVKTCAFSASGIDLDRKISTIDAKRCKGCGNCVTACPTRARDLIAFPTDYVHNAIEILSRGTGEPGEPKILAFMCKNSGYLAADAAGLPENRSGGGGYATNVLPLRIECAGNVDTLYILHALKQGFDGVALVVCKDGHCHNLVGNTDMERRLGLLRAVLRSRMIDDNRMRIIHTYGHEGRGFNEEIKAFSDELKALARP